MRNLNQTPLKTTCFLLTLLLSCSKENDRFKKDSDQSTENVQPMIGQGGQNGNSIASISMTPEKPSRPNSIGTIPASPVPVATLSPNSAIFFNPDEPSEDNPNFKWLPFSDFGTEVFSEYGPSRSELKQGQDGDCTLFAVLGSIVSQCPGKIKNIIKRVGNTTDNVGVYSVALYNSDTNSLNDVLVDERFLQHVFSDNGRQLEYDMFYFDATNNNVIIWSMLIQKAVALQSGGYQSILKSASAQIYALTGDVGIPIVNSYVLSTDSNRAINQLLKYIGQGYVTTMDSILNDPTKPNDDSQTAVFQNTPYNCATVGNENYCLVQNHEYELISFDGANLVLRNPWGENIGANSNDNGVFTIPFQAYSALSQQTYASSKKIINLL